MTSRSCCAADVARSLRLVSLVLLAALCGVVGWAGFAPIQRDFARASCSRFRKGTYARRRAGDLVEILPDRIRLTLGLNDVLLIHNLDDVPQTFGPTIMMPGQSFRLPFERAASYQFVCTAHASGQLTIEVEPEPRDAVGADSLAHARLVGESKEMKSIEACAAVAGGDRGAWWRCGGPWSR